MKHTDGIEVRIRLCGEDEYLAEYDTPLMRTPNNESGSRIIRGESGKRIEVVVDISEEFEMYSANTLFILTGIDPTGKPEIESYQTWAIRRRRKAPAVTYTFSAFTRWEDAASKPTDVPFLMPEPDSAYLKVSVGQKVNDSVKYPRKGTIWVSVVRGKLESPGEGVTSDRGPYDRPKDPIVNFTSPVVVNEDYMKRIASDNGFSRWFEFCNIGDAEAPFPLTVSSKVNGDSQHDDDDETMSEEDEDELTEDSNASDSEHDDLFAPNRSRRRSSRQRSARQKQAASSTSNGHRRSRRLVRDSRGIKPRRNLPDDEDDEEVAPAPEDIVKIKQEHDAIDLTIEEDEATPATASTPAARSVKTEESVSASVIPSRKRGESATTTTRSAEEIKRRKKEKNKMKLQLEQSILKQKLLEYEDNDDE